MIRQSIRSRIQLWHTTLLAVIVGGLLAAFFYHQKEILTQQIDRDLSSELVRFLPHYEPIPGPGLTQAPFGRNPPPPSPFRQGAPNRPPPPQLLEEKKRDLVEHGIHLMVWSDSQLIDETENAPAGRAPPELDWAESANASRTVGDQREFIHRTRSGVVLLFGQPLAALERELESLALELGAIWLGVVALGFGVGWALITRSLRPIRSISDSARQIAHGDLSRRIDTADTESELGQLAEVLNESFAQLEDSFEQQRRFTADASHELRTPLSVILAKCQFALMRDRSAEKYREALSVCEASAQHMRGIVESLLDLARVDSGEFTLRRSPSDLGQLARECGALLGTLAERRQIELVADCPATPCVLDPERIRQVITNLLSNAIKFTPPGGRVCLAVETRGEDCLLRVSDNGPGIAADDLPHIFDRFFRADRGRSQEHKGTGLGLAIARAIVEAHGGEIHAQSTPGEGSCFELRLPRNR